ncbi:MAG: hypothetical protein K2F77_01680, partial [Muribaculaceae bacterium]|nr:hypothetical protein [Muribaculaceae bacterium]
TICESKTNLGCQPTYTRQIVALEYPADAPKAGKIYVRFLSTNVSEALTKDENWLNGPGRANLSRGEYSGSTLYIDDIELTY